MNETDFKTVTSIVTTTENWNSGTEIWVRYVDGREASYRVADPSFRCRAGQHLTAVLYGPHPVLLRNDSTGMKIQLLAGRNFVGTKPGVPPFSWSGWFVWFLFISVVVGIFGPLVYYVVQGRVIIVQYLATIITIVLSVGLLFGVPYWLIVHPRLRGFLFELRAMKVDKIIARMFDQF